MDLMVQVSLTPQECAMLMALLEECMKRDRDHPRREGCEELYESLVKQIGEQLDGGAIH